MGHAAAEDDAERISLIALRLVAGLSALGLLLLMLAAGAGIFLAATH